MLIKPEPEGILGCVTGNMTVADLLRSNISMHEGASGVQNLQKVEPFEAG